MKFWRVGVQVPRSTDAEYVAYRFDRAARVDRIDFSNIEEHEGGKSVWATTSAPSAAAAKRKVHEWVLDGAKVKVHSLQMQYGSRTGNPKKITKTVTTSTQTVRVRNPYAMFSNPHGCR